MGEEYTVDGDTTLDSETVDAYDWKEDGSWAAELSHLTPAYAAWLKGIEVAQENTTSAMEAAMKPRLAFTPIQAMQQYTEFLGDMTEAYTDNVERTVEYIEQAGNVPDAIEMMRETDIGPTPARIVYEDDKIEVLEYEQDLPGDKQQDVPMSLTYARINRPSVFDLGPETSVADQFLQEGFPVYLSNWKEPVDPDSTLKDHVEQIDTAVDVILEAADSDTVNILGYCQGGTESAMHAALHPEKVENLGLMAAGLYFDDTGGELEQQAKTNDPTLMIGPDGYIKGEALAVAFAAQDWEQNFVKTYRDHLFDILDDREALEQFARMEYWNDDFVDVAGGPFEEFLEKIYRGNELAENALHLDGEHVDINNIDMPVAFITGEYDHLVPPEATTQFDEVIPSDDTQNFEYSGGHIGVSTSPRAHNEFWPEIVEWYTERSG